MEMITIPKSEYERLKRLEDIDFDLLRQMKELERLKGSSKPRKLLSKEERDKIARELNSKKSEEITKKYNLNKFKL